MGRVVPLEAAVVERIVRVLKARGAWYVKTTGVAKVGCPDLLVCYKGRFVAVEVKRHRESSYGVTRRQQLELDRIGKSGGYAIVAYGVDEVVAILEQIDASAQS